MEIWGHSRDRSIGWWPSGWLPFYSCLIALSALGWQLGGGWVSSQQSMNVLSESQPLIGPHPLRGESESAAPQYPPQNRPFDPGPSSPYEPVNDFGPSQPSQPSTDELGPISLDQPLGLSQFWFDAVDLGYQAPAWRGQLGQLEIQIWGLARAALRSDQRYQFTGLETTFLTEGQWLADVRQQTDQWSYGCLLEGFFNQRYDRNVLDDYPLRESFQHNFDVDTLEISQAFLNLRRGDWAVDVGKFVTPFGRYYGGQYVNSRSDAPFIRTESILFRETGLQLRYEPEVWRVALAITNGSQDGDTNSSKAMISRVGWEHSQWAGGTSVKWQDGIGSEGHKQFNNHVGVDLAYRSGRWLCWGECIYDQYGSRRPGLDLDDITWGRSLYNRQINRGPREALTGVGWYVQMIRNDRWGSTQLGYGEFHPEFVGDEIHDQITRRGLLKRNWMVTPHLEWFVFSTLENQVENAQDGRLRSGLAWGSGISFHF